MPSSVVVMTGGELRRAGSSGALSGCRSTVCDGPSSPSPILRAGSGSNLSRGSVSPIKVRNLKSPFQIGGFKGTLFAKEPDHRAPIKGEEKDDDTPTKTRLLFWPHTGLGGRRGSLQEYEIIRNSHGNIANYDVNEDRSFDASNSNFDLSRHSPVPSDRTSKSQTLEFDTTRQEVPEMSERLFKVIIIGDPTVGKTSFVQRYVQDSFRRDYKGTVGVDFALKILKWSDSETIKLQLWDIAGQERFTWMTRVYYKDAQGCIIMFDLTNRNSFLNTLKWKKDVDSKCTLEDGSPIPCMLLANKCDLPHRQVDQLEIEKLYKDHNFTGWTETSAKEGLMVTDSMRFLVDVMMKQKNHRDEDSDETSLRLTPAEPEQQRSCYC
ncbi:ras-related protein Rab-32-like [Palaemon carinicauda]|uniref:ras-related protein Rab-32-like n=1 Tax=Palaemon carinicauda TaxID=392227 RepID=UPI0035B646D7